MRSIALLTATLAVFLLSGCVSLIMDAAQHAGANVHVLLAVEPAPAPYVLHLARYDEATQSLDSDRLGDVLVRVDASAVPTYVSADLKPGTYVISSLFQQMHWVACFYNDTRSFTVNANDAVFLGDFRPGRHLDQMASIAESKGETKAGGLNLITYYDNILPPQLTTPTPDSADFLAAKSYAAVSQPQFKGRLQPVVYKPAKFKLGTDLVGAQHCW